MDKILEQYDFRCPDRHDALAIAELAKMDGSYPREPVYYYLLMVEHFTSHSVVASDKDNGRIDGFALAYRPPVEPDVIFVCSLAVRQCAKSTLLGSHLLDCLLDSKANSDAHYLSAYSVNHDSWLHDLFSSFADCHKVSMTSESYPVNWSLASPGQGTYLRLGPFTAT